MSSLIAVVQGVCSPRRVTQNLQAHILFERPANVREFMIEYLTKLKTDEEDTFDAELVPKEVRPVAHQLRRCSDAV